MSALDGLNAAIANLQAQVTAENAELTEVVNGLVAAREQIQALQDQLNSGTQVTAADLDAVTQTITQVADSAAAATASATTATAPPPAPPAPAP